MGPLRAAACEWRERAGVEAEWSARPLAAFNDQPVEELALDADPLVVDHPCCKGLTVRNAFSSWFDG